MAHKRRTAARLVDDQGPLYPESEHLRPNWPMSAKRANRRHARVGGAVVRVPALLRPLPIVLRAAAQRPPFGFNSVLQWDCTLQRRQGGTFMRKIILVVASAVAL